MEFTKEEMLDIVSTVSTEYDKMIKAEKEGNEVLAKNENDNESANENKELTKYEYTAEDMEKMYGEMDKAEAQDHYDAVKKVMTKMEMDKMEDIKKTELEKAEAASEQDKISKMAMEKKEKEEKEKKDKDDKDKDKDKDKKDKDKKDFMDKMEKEYMAKMAMEKNEVESQGKELTKSESEIELEKIKVENDKLKAENTELMKKSEDGEAVQEEFAKFVKLLEGDEAAPSQKSITNMDFIAKNEDGSEDSKNKSSINVEEMSKTEVSAILAKKSADPETNAKDRKAINSYILENTDINEIKHLLQGE